MSDRDLPPIPIPPPSEPPLAGSSRRHSHRSKNRTSVRELAAVILLEQQEHHETQRELVRLTEKLRLATLRAEEAESRVEEVTARLKSVNEARLVAVREAARANESLGHVLLYKFQLETAQNEIHRAQSVFDIVEKERYHAELAGAKSRTTARKLSEQQKIHLAREEGRRIGMQEGIEAGRHYELGADARPAPSTFGESQYDYYDENDLYDDGLDSPGGSLASEEFISPRNGPSVLPRTHARDTPAPLPIPPPVPTAFRQPAGAPLSPLFTPFHDIHPISIHNEVPHPQHERYDVPPDGFIPSLGPDSLPQVPPPHEFLRHQLSPSPPRNARSSVVEEPGIAPSAFARAISNNGRQTTSQRAPSARAESVRRAPSTRAESVGRAPSTRAESSGSVHPVVHMPTPRMNSDLPGIERQAQRQSFASSASDFYGGAPAPVRPPPSNDSSSAIPISVQPPSRPISHLSSGHVGTPSMGSALFGPDVAAPSRRSIHADAGPSSFQPEHRDGGISPMPGTYALPPEDPPYDSFNHVDSPSTHSSDLQTSTPNTLTTPPGQRRPHPHKPPRKKNPAAWPRGPGFGYDGNVASTSRT
ncbi:hypothetical protein B0H16DRAFT_1447103 [Mycena metata]|uniref:Uncharacterized protein n=1 Tax=Mycena metata TaxID=1033252 RepID=A0AAD7P0B1_9AGAR|nr:hypothetical protein B0H16DRAFT_1447103 [Mycena metata]